MSSWVVPTESETILEALWSLYKHTPEQRRKLELQTLRQWDPPPWRPTKADMFSCSREFWRMEFDRRDIALRGLRYADYRCSDAYVARRQSVIDRANGTCEGCESLGTLVVHHLHYRTLWKETPEDLVAICGTCHHRIHYPTPPRLAAEVDVAVEEFLSSLVRAGSRASNSCPKKC